MSRKINVVDDRGKESELENFCRQLGHEWPPRHQAEAVAILTKAKFSQQRIDQFLAQRFGGFEGVGELPQGYVSTGPGTVPLPGKSRDDYPTDRVLTADEHAELYGQPVFTAMLVEGLRPVVAEFNARAALEAGQSQRAWAAEWVEVVFWLKDRFCANEPNSGTFRESEAKLCFPELRNLDALWAVLENEQAIGAKRFGHFVVELPDSDTEFCQAVLPTADDLRSIEPGIVAFAASLQPTRTIIPAEQWAAAWQLSKCLDDILSWATYPEKKSLSVGWWDRCKHDITQATNTALNSFDGDGKTLDKIRQTKSLTFKFVGLLHHNPSLSSIAVQDWPVQAYRVLFDDLSAMKRDFAAMGQVPRNPKRKVAARLLDSQPVPTGELQKFKLAACDVLLLHYRNYQLPGIHSANFATQMRATGCQNVEPVVDSLVADGLIVEKRDSYQQANVYHFEPESIRHFRDQHAPAAAAEPDVDQKTELGQLGHRKIVLPTDPDVADVWNTVQAATDGTANVSEICRDVARKSGAKAESLRRKFNRWKSKNLG